MLIALGDSTGGLQNALESAKLDGYRETLASLDRRLQSHIAIAYRGLAVAALIWCRLSWRTEGRVAVGIAVLFTALAIAASLFSFL